MNVRKPINMLSIESLEDIAILRERADVECKLAQGRDGQGEFPKDAWKTYSAFANSYGGDIFLGLREKSGGSFELKGIKNTQKVLDEFWANITNQQKVSCNLVSQHCVQTIEIDGLTIIQIHVPAASRQQRPVYLNKNPLTGTFKRLHTGDMQQNEIAVKRMLAEQSEESRDIGILQGYGLDDLDIDSFNAYRQIYTNLNPDHPWNKLDAQRFLYHIGGWSHDRQSGCSGLTAAGLLMFGSYRPILEVFPNYMLDYQERLESETDERWIDRLVPDGSWSGNLFDFYQRIINKLTINLKIPFVLANGQRQDDTLVHKALREALVNTLVHADYTERASVLVIKKPDIFSFRNPGNMRVPIELALEGSHSDCRNRNLQRMFRFIGLGENAGSGLPKIFDGWRSQHWRLPVLRERSQPNEQTLLELHTLSLVPEKVIAQLREDLGAKVFDGLTEQERLILITAHIEITVDHNRMISMLTIHPRDLSNIFSGLVARELLIKEGTGRGTVYCLPSARFLDIVNEIFDSNLSSGGLDSSSGGLDPSSGGLSPSSGGLSPSSGGLSPSSGGLSPSSGGLSPSSGGLSPSSGGLSPSSGGLSPSSGGLSPSSGGLSPSSGGLGPSSGGLDPRPRGLEQLEIIANAVASKKKAPKSEVEDAILALCTEQPCSLEQLADLLNRSVDLVRKNYLQPLVRAKRLRYQYPTRPNHPQQMYITEDKH